MGKPKPIQNQRRLSLPNHSHGRTSRQTKGAEAPVIDLRTIQPGSIQDEIHADIRLIFQPFVPHDVIAGDMSRFHQFPVLPFRILDHPRLISVVHCLALFVVGVCLGYALIIGNAPRRRCKPRRGVCGHLGLSPYQESPESLRKAYRRF